MENGKWRMQNGELKMENAELKIENKTCLERKDCSCRFAELVEFAAETVPELAVAAAEPAPDGAGEQLPAGDRSWWRSWPRTHRRRAWPAVRPVPH